MRFEIFHYSEDDCEEEESSVEWDAYADYPFAMEVVNGDILSMTDALQEEVRRRISKTLGFRGRQFASVMHELEEDRDAFTFVHAPDEAAQKLRDCLTQFDFDTLSEILGYDAEERKFRPTGIGFLSSHCGWEAKDLLNALGYPLQKNISEGPHGHGTNGVIYYEK